jgi:nucleotide-binding universal stress UspA family protein
MRTYRRILVPVDGSSTSDKALVAALQIARDAGGRVLLVHAVDELAYLTGFESSADVLTLVRQGGERVLAGAKDVAASAGVEAETRFLDEPGRRLGESIAKEANDWPADLIVLGTHGRRGVERMLLGSGAEQIIRRAPVPVLVIRGED